MTNYVEDRKKDSVFHLEEVIYLVKVRLTKPKQLVNNTNSFKTP